MKKCAILTIFIAPSMPLTSRHAFKYDPRTHTELLNPWCINQGQL